MAYKTTQNEHYIQEALTWHMRLTTRCDQDIACIIDEKKDEIEEEVFQKLLLPLSEELEKLVKIGEKAIIEIVNQATRWACDGVKKQQFVSPEYILNYTHYGCCENRELFLIDTKDWDQRRMLCPMKAN
jgi:hypothetical protein